ncbi:MAG: aminopeptidase P family protein [Anaerolineales bacterium]|nr:aminopeptidase P family protein [Anaerolineales bacterium]
MKSDIDALMQDRNLDALMILGPAYHNPAMVYLTGGGHVSGGYLIKKRGETPTWFCAAMERDEAAKSDLPIKLLDDFRFDELLKQSEGNMLKASAARLKLVLESAGITSGRVALYGQAEVGASYALLTALQETLPELTLVGEIGDSLLLAAMATKEPAEIERIRRMGKITTAVVAQTADFLTSHQVQNEVLVKADGSPLTIEAVKKQINLWLAEHGAENPEGTIFAIGRDAGVPHSAGNPTDLLRLGQTIVYDIYPCEPGGGYFYDFTRTWCLGYASDQALALYEDVLSVYRQVTSELRLGALCSIYQERTCELFQAQGHPTLKDNPQTLEGYVHSLGHGVGLNIHERPFFRLTPNADDRLEANVVITVEPGLYYPERGMGVRLENTYWMRPDGKAEILAEYPLDLVLPMKKR